MSYKINTVVSHRGGGSNNDNLISVLCFVDSLSNYVSNSPVHIKSTGEFTNIFPDAFKDYSKTLLDAYHILEMGYNVICVNVRRCPYQEALRLCREDDGSLSELWFDSGAYMSDRPTTVHATTQLAVKFPIDEIAEGKYILLEHDINNKPCNTLIYFSSDPSAEPPISSAHYAANSCFRFDPTQEMPELIKNIGLTLMTKKSYSMRFSPVGDIELAFPYQFNLPEYIDGDDTQRIYPTYDDNYCLEYVSSAKNPSGVLDIYSVYRSDMIDLEFEITSVGGQYTFNLYKYSGNKILDTFSISGDDIAELVTEFNRRNGYTQLSISDSNVPTGKWKLKLPEKRGTVSYLSYRESIIDIGRQDVEDLTLLNASILYEPDLNGIASEGQIKELQDLLMSFFSSEECPIIKFLTYHPYSNIGIGDKFTAFFTDADYLYNKNVCSTAMMYLYDMVDILADKYITTVQTNRPCTIEDKDLPYFVNRIEDNYRSIRFDRVKVRYNDNYYDIRDLLLISTFNILLNSAEKTDVTDVLIVDIIEIIEQYFQRHFQYNPSIKLTGFVKISEDTVHITISYFTSDMREVTALNLVLDLT